MNKFLACLVLAVCAIVSVNGQCPTIVSRSGWGARPANSGILPTRPAPWVVIHHTASAACTTQAACSIQMRSIQNSHINTNGWADIGYNFLVGGDGLVYEGRGWGRQGAHSPGYNSRSVGISFIGTFTTELPVLAARNNAQALIRCGVNMGNISSAYWLIGHRQDIATECPGTSLFNEIRTWAQFNANP